MEKIVTQEEIRKIEDYVINKVGISALVLMEKAAMAIKQEIDHRKCSHTTRVLIMAGTGNNGADGLCLARLLALDHYDVTVLVSNASHKKTTEYLAQENSIQYYDVKVIREFPVEQFDIVVDAIFGFGLNREIEGEYADWIKKANQITAYKIAVDIPSGINTDEGRILGCAFHADETVTFSYLKPAHLFYPGTEYCGKVKVRSIGFPAKCDEEVLGEASFVTMGESENPLPIRRKDGHKGTFGKVLLVGGFEDMPGAIVMAATAALKSGAGMIKVVSEARNRDFILQMIKEAQFTPVEKLEDELEWPDVIVVGPGLGVKEKSEKALKTVLNKAKDVHLILDADALNLLAEHQNGCMDALRNNHSIEVVMTPHMGELKRLTGSTMSELKQPSEQATRTLAQKENIVIVKKDARTCVFCGRMPIYVNCSGNEGMGTGGSGDVLSGIIAGLVAQNRKNTYNMVCAAVYLHGLCGDKVKERLGSYAVTAGEMIEVLPEVMMELLGNRN